MFLISPENLTTGLGQRVFSLWALRHFSTQIKAVDVTRSEGEGRFADK
jgi:hypothetical protein